MYDLLKQWIDASRENKDLTGVDQILGIESAEYRDCQIELAPTLNAPVQHGEDDAPAALAERLRGECKTAAARGSASR